jgi:hypothetical protein
MAPIALTAWAVPKLRSLIPIDDESLKEAVDYAANLSSKEAVGNHFKVGLYCEANDIDTDNSRAYWANRRSHWSLSQLSMLDYLSQIAMGMFHQSSIDLEKRKLLYTNSRMHQGRPTRARHTNPKTCKVAY